MTAITEALWVERYRPETLDDIIGNDQIIKQMRSFLDNSECPNILFAGPQGTGKTAIVQAFAKELYGDTWRNNVLEMNASDERGIDTVRERIKKFARQGTTGDYDFSIIFLDEVDSMTKDAQAAMRRVMEDYSDNTRFFMSCNYPNKLIPPLQSRCAIFRVDPLQDEDIEHLIREVMLQEGIEEEGEAVDLLVDYASGDARKAINSLQAATVDGELTEQGVEAVSSVVSYDQVNEIITKAEGGDLDRAMEMVDNEVLKEGVSEQAFLDAALSVIKKLDVPNDARVKMIDQLAEADWRIMQGANPHVQIHALISKIHIARHMSLPNYEEE